VVVPGDPPVPVIDRRLAGSTLLRCREARVPSVRSYCLGIGRLAPDGQRETFFDLAHRIRGCFDFSGPAGARPNARKFTAYVSSGAVTRGESARARRAFQGGGRSTGSDDFPLKCKRDCVATVSAWSLAARDWFDSGAAWRPDSAWHHTGSGTCAKAGPPAHRYRPSRRPCPIPPATSTEIGDG